MKIRDAGQAAVKIPRRGRDNAPGNGRAQVLAPACGRRRCNGRGDRRSAGSRHGARLLRVRCRTLRAGGIHLRREEQVAVSAPRLRVVHGDIGVVQQDIEMLVEGIERDADAGADECLVPVEAERPRQLVEDFLRDRRGVLDVANLRQQHGEFVAAQPRHGILLAYADYEPFADASEEEVAVGVPEVVVDGFEPVEVEEHDRAEALVAVRLGHGLTQAVEEQQPVRQAGEGVVMRQPVQMRLRALGDRLQQIVTCAHAGVSPVLGENETLVHVAHAGFHDGVRQVIEIDMEIDDQWRRVHERRDRFPAEELARKGSGEVLEHLFAVHDPQGVAVGHDRQGDQLRTVRKQPEDLVDRQGRRQGRGLAQQAGGRDRLRRDTRVETLHERCMPVVF